MIMRLLIVLAVLVCRWFDILSYEGFIEVMLLFICLGTYVQYDRPRP